MERVGQVWEHSHSWQRDGLGAVRLLFLVVEAGRRRGSDHHNPHTVLWTHACLNLETAETFEAREWSDEPWEERKHMTRVL